jgi:voltage-gated potassium channel Kch
MYYNVAAALGLFLLNRLLPLVVLACLVLALASCRTVGLGSNVTPDSEYYADTYRRGTVDVICLQGMHGAQGGQDTLFGCLQAARDQGMGTVDLPEDVYLGHVAEFIVRSLKYYEIEEHFERFYGYRIVLKFREASVRERKEGEMEDYSGMLLGTAGELALTGIGVAAVPLTPLIFAYKAARSDLQRQEVAEYAQKHGLPEPTRSSGEAAFNEVRESYARMARHAGKAVGVSGSDAILDTYIVETCYLAKPGMEEVLHIAGRINDTDSSIDDNYMP